jgi:hypothetical protein
VNEKDRERARRSWKMKEVSPLSPFFNEGKKKEKRNQECALFYALSFLPFQMPPFLCVKKDEYIIFINV